MWPEVHIINGWSKQSQRHTNGIFQQKLSKWIEDTQRKNWASAVPYVVIINDYDNYQEVVESIVANVKKEKKKSSHPEHNPIETDEMVTDTEQDIAETSTIHSYTKTDKEWKI
ncbi:12479_t:CDS:2 [Gigaspora margarita]|uniref:12479_t:CDS:1 n=1 Tax=Gigaspora margarita TaxID=4874 RepID=A0ABM8VVT5_GIGMA|nr:12479_t:CDS:2 [Gigaspora margarita]